MLFSLLKHYLDTDTALKVSQSVYCFTTSISHGVENYFPRLWGTGISDAIFLIASLVFILCKYFLPFIFFGYEVNACHVFSSTYKIIPKLNPLNYNIFGRIGFFFGQTKMIKSLISQKAQAKQHFQMNVQSAGVYINFNFIEVCQNLNEICTINVLE